MRKWLVGFAVLCIAIGAVYLKRHDPARAAFDRLPVPQQNLAMYDAFWAALDANYYDPKALETPHMRELRSTWRLKAEAVDAIRIYWDVLQPLAGRFPHSHVDVRPNFSAADVLGVVSGGDSQRREKLQKAFAAGPGFEAPTVRRADGLQWIVGDVLTGSPAAKAGITPGWKVLSANNTFSHDGSASFAGEFAADVRGDPIKIRFDLEPGAERAHYEMKRVGDGITYLRFDLFGQAGEPDNVIAAIDFASPRGLVLDLRYNIGGINDDLKRIAGRVLGDGVPLGTMRGRGPAVEERTNATRHYAGPLVVLIGPTSASAAEILAAAVQDHARGKVIGRTSNGSVLSAQYFPLPGGGSVMVPMHDYSRIDGRRIEGIGVAPDIEVMPTLEDVRAGRDPALARALDVLRGTGR